MLARALVIVIMAFSLLVPSGVAGSLPDIIVVILDDMRTDDWSALPETQQLLSDGTWFPNFTITTPVCCPSRTTILTGRYAHNHGVRRNRSGFKAFVTHGNGSRTVAVSLQQAGYRTALVGKYLNGYPRSRPVPSGWDNWHVVRKPRYGKQERALANHAIAIAGELRDQPLFLVYAPKAPHGPLGGIRNARELRPRDYDRYDGLRRQALARVDADMVRIAAAMGDRWERACVTVLSDNGFLIGEHGLTGKGVPWAPATVVPALVRCAGVVPGPDERLAATIDVAPTVLRAAGLNPSTEMDGRALQDDWTRTAVLIEGWPQGKPAWRGIRTRDGWLYVEWANGRVGLYDRRTDPRELENLANVVDPETVSTLASMLTAFHGCRGETCRIADGGP